MNVWELDGVTKRYRTARILGGATVTALDRVSLKVDRGERVALIGESGSGKTTLARVGLGLLGRDAGTVRLFGDDTATWGRRRWRGVRRRAQLLFQHPRAMLHPSIPIGLLLEEGARLHRPEDDAVAAAGEALASVGLEDRGEALPSQLSGGEQRRAGLARVLLSRPQLIVADEPTAGLDAALKADLVGLLLERMGAGCALVLISHDLALAAWACERVVVMRGGHVVDAFPVQDIGSGAPRHPHTAQLLASAGLRRRDDAAGEEA